MKVLLKNGEIREALFEEQRPNVFGADAELKQEGRMAFWHTSAHVLAQAVKHLYPDAKCAGGSAIENGFYYDFDFGFPFAEEHLQELEAEMRQIIRKSLSLQVYALSLEEVKAYMEEHGECYQLELLRNLSGEKAVSFYRQMDKVPYMVILGEKEQAGHTVSVRRRDAEAGKQDMGEMGLNALIEMLRSQEGQSK